MDEISLVPSAHESDVLDSANGYHSELPEAASNCDENREVITEIGSKPAPCSIPPTNEYTSAVNEYYFSRRELAKLYHCADMRELAFECADNLMGEHFTTLQNSVIQFQTSAQDDSDELINSAVKLVCGAGHPNLSLLRTFPAEDIRKWLLLEGTQVALIGSPEEISCTGLCGKVPEGLMCELRKCAKEGRANLRNRVGFEQALQLRHGGFYKQTPTYRGMLEHDALCVHMQCIEVVVGPDPLTVCKKIATLEDIRRGGDLVRGIVLTEGCGSCQLVVQLAALRGAVITHRVTEPRHIAAYLVLALQYSGEELLWLFDQWHRAQTGQPLPLGIAPDEWLPVEAESDEEGDDENTGSSGGSKGEEGG
jgi:hypothetical protein